MSDVLNATLYPWNRELFASLLQRFQQQQLAHGLLISGRAGLGKLALARHFAARLLCSGAGDQAQACGQCKSCQLFAAETHPDYLEIASEAASGGILIDQIRQVNHFAALKSQLGGVQVVVIDAANRMNRNAANALLKTLEEPNDNLHLLLLSENTQGLLPTIRSRCQHYRSGEPDMNQQIQWLADKFPQATPSQLRQALAMAYGAPPLAAQLLANDAPTAEQKQLQLFLNLSAGRLSAEEVAWVYQSDELANLLSSVYAWIVDMIRFKSGLTLADRYTEQQATELSRVARDLHIDNLFDYTDRVIEALRLRHTQVNPQLLVEQLLIVWQRMCSQRAAIAVR